MTSTVGNFVTLKGFNLRYGLLKTLADNFLNLCNLSLHGNFVSVSKVQQVVFTNNQGKGVSRIA